MMSDTISQSSYKYGFVTDIETDAFPKGLDESVIEALCAKKNEPEWMLDFRIKAYRHWKTLPEPHLPELPYDPINYQEMCYYSAPKKKPKLNDMSEVDPKDRKFKPFSAFFPCGGEGKTWRGA